jgi:hypothetical protein
MIEMARREHPRKSCRSRQGNRDRL